MNSPLVHFPGGSRRRRQTTGLLNSPASSSASSLSHPVSHSNSVWVFAVSTHFSCLSVRVPLALSLSARDSFVVSSASSATAILGDSALAISKAGAYFKVSLVL